MVGSVVRGKRRRGRRRTGFIAYQSTRPRSHTILASNFPIRPMARYRAFATVKKTNEVKIQAVAIVDVFHDLTFYPMCSPWSLFFVFFRLFWGGLVWLITPEPHPHSDQNCIQFSP